MKIAAISDIHGNLLALDAVLADIRLRAVDVVVNLGDILSGALQPLETADRLIPLQLPTIRGNHERQVLAGDPARMGLSDLRAFSSLRADQMAWIDSLPATLRLNDDVLLVHGTPDSDLTYFLDVVSEQGARAATQVEAARSLGDTTASLILCGHTHVPRVMPLDDGRVIVNPGSVGLQAYKDDRPFPHRMETGSPHARYATATLGADGWEVELHAVAYDWNAAAAMAVQNGRPDWVAPLLTGYVESPPGA
ncbi:putative phosphodiesterase [Actimicrobium sp. GrIS 1.19]|uniref:metallophosphoesterase family protein n=1 Tax=Actimicrobium sp. GrIS 1.19 TaxID=3071708 RepID=UPI002DFE7518|nr:putative phosphodiesterase [Actimicrobium sp. GrIS 1.19]